MILLRFVRELVVQGWCLVVGHEPIVDRGRFRCLRCLRVKALF
jgi:hypothetical protein